MLKSWSAGWKIFGAAGLLLVLAAVFWLAYEVCWLGKFSIQPEPPEPAAFFVADSEFRVAILKSEYTARFLGSSPRYEGHAQYWQRLLQSLKIRWDSISDGQLEGDLKPYRVLVLPSAVCLSEKETANIRAFVKDGKGVISTWATGTRNEHGKWKGWDFLRELTGADSFEPDEGNPPWFVSFLAGSPITAGAPAGARVQVASPERLKATALNVDGYWGDARLFPVDSSRPSNFQGAVLRHQLERGRVVWYGFQENSAVAGGNDKALVDSVLSNGIFWAGQQLLYTVDAWPSNYSAAVVLALETDEDYENATYAVNVLLKSQAKGTFFCDADVVKKNPELMRYLKRAGEVAVEGTPPSHFTQSRILPQLILLETPRWKLWRLVGRWASGFVSPATLSTPVTLRALVGARYRYYLTSLEGNSVRPVMLKVSQSWAGLHRELKLVRLARTTDDDLHLSPLGTVGLAPQWIVRRVLSDFDTVSGLGGLYVLAYHTRGLSAPEYAGALSQLIEHWRGHAAWVATAEEVADWWTKKSQVSVSISGRGPNSFRVRVASRAQSPIEGVVLSLYPPPDSLHARVMTFGAQSALPQVIPDQANEHIRLMFEKLDPGKTLTYEVEFGP